MPYQKKDFDFTLFINEGVVGNRPAVSGTIYINGQEVPIAGWKRTTKTGKPVYSGCKSVRSEQKPQETQNGWDTHDAGEKTPFNDPIPF